jgi:hypothetical protein
MRINFTLNKNNQGEQQPDELLQVTALAYLQDALANERYEECAQLVKAARLYGAEGREIQKVLADGAKRARFGRAAEPVRKPAGVRRF